MSDCLFCKIIAREIPSEVVTETSDLVVLKDINPKAPTHLLIVPKKHIATINDLTKQDHDLIGRLVLQAQALAKEVGFADSGYRLLWNCNQDGGQTVYHIHLHLLGGRLFSWPPG